MTDYVMMYTNKLNQINFTRVGSPTMSYLTADNTLTI